MKSNLPGELPPSLRFTEALYLSDEGAHEEVLAMLGAMDQEFYPTQFLANSVSLESAHELMALGRTDEAVAAAERAAEALEQEVLSNPNDPRMHGALGRAYALLGRDQEARRESERAVKLQPLEMDAMEGAARLYELAITSATLGDVEKTIEVLDQILTANKSWASVPLIETAEIYDFLRDHPDYKKMIEKHR